MKKISNTKFLLEHYGANAGIPWPSRRDKDVLWEILGWCENPPFDSTRKGFAVLFEYIKDFDDVEAGQKVWFHYNKESLEQLGIKTESLGICKHVGRGEIFKDFCHEPAVHIVQSLENGEVILETPLCQKHTDLCVPFKRTIIQEMVIK